MKSTILPILCLASSVAAWGSVRTGLTLDTWPPLTPRQVELCPTSRKVDRYYGCGTFTFADPGCFTLPIGGDTPKGATYPRPRLHNNTHFVAPSEGLRCLVYE